MARRAVDRRTFIGTAGAGLVAGLAGCSGETGSGSDGAGTDGGTGDDGTGGATAGGGPLDGAATLGILLPFSGANASVGERVESVVQLVADRINANGGIDGRELSLVRGDTGSNGSSTADAAERLVGEEGADLLVGPDDDGATRVVGMAGSNQVPVISPAAGTSEIDDRGGDFFFRTTPSDTLAARAIARGIYFRRHNGEKEYRRMAMLVSSSSERQAFKEAVKSEFRGLGGQITTDVSMPPGADGYRDRLSQVVGSNPEITFLSANLEDTERVLRDAALEGYGRQWIVPQNLTGPSFSDEIPDQFREGILGVTPADDPGAVESGQLGRLESAMSEAGGDVDALSKAAFDAAVVGAAAMRAAIADEGSIEPAAVASAISQVGNPPGTEVRDYASAASELAGGGSVNYEGVVGPCDFDESGDVSAPFAVTRNRANGWQARDPIPASEF